MEVSILVSVVVSMVCLFAWMMLNWLWIRPKKLERIIRSQGFQGNHYRLLFGDSKDKARMISETTSKPMSHLSNDIFSYVHPFSHHIAEKYGKKNFTWYGPLPMVSISDPKEMKEVFTNIHAFQKPKGNPFMKMTVGGMFLLEGEKWAKQRKLVNPAFHLEKLKLMVHAASACSNEMICEWEKMISEKGFCEIDVAPYLHKMSADVISQVAFGSSYEEGRIIFKLLTELIVISFPLIKSFYIPGWRFLPTRVNRRMKELNREIRVRLENIITKRIKLKKDGQKPMGDLLDRLLESSDVHEKSKNESNTCLSLDEVIEECKLFYLAGQQTTSTLLVWTLVMLGKHQDWQKRAREEILSVFGNKVPDFDELNQLKTVQMILQEVLRLYPPVSDAPRVVSQDIKLGDYALPAGVLVDLPILQVHHEENLWGEDAQEFNPGRFSEGISKASGGNMSFFTFGWGPRTCIGLNFAYIEAKMVLALILQRFSFDLSPSYAHSPIFVGELHPQFGAQIIVKPL